MTLAHTTPAPIPESARRVLLFGGSFDPPHLGHFQLPESVRQRLGADFILYIPAARSPHKKDSPSATPQLRVEMLRAGLKNNASAAVWTVELDRATNDPDAPSYTIDTIRELRRQRPDLSLRLLIGADQARAFHKWREPSAILRIAPPAVMLRDDTHAGHSAAHLINDLARIWGNDQARRWASWIVPAPMLDISSTLLRTHLARWSEGPPPPDMSAALPHDREAAVQSVLGDSPTLCEYVLNPLSVQIYEGHIGIVHYSYSATVLPNDGQALNVTGKWSEVYLKKNGTWKMISVSGRPDEPKKLNAEQVAEKT